MRRIKFQVREQPMGHCVVIWVYEVEIGEAGKFVIHRPIGGGKFPAWVVSEWHTTRLVGKGATRKLAIEDARLNIIKTCGSLKRFPAYVREKFPKEVEHERSVKAS